MYRDHAISVRNTQLTHGFIVLWLLTCLCVAIFARDFLPAKYLFDAGNIASRFGYVDRFVVGEAYDNTALFYELLFLSGSPHLAAFIIPTVFSVFTLKCMTVQKPLGWGALHSLVLYAFICFVSAVYLGQYSKEATSMLVTMAFFYMSRTLRTRLIWLLIACVYAAFFRPYWFIVVAMYFYYGFFLKRSRHMTVFMLSIVLAILMLALAFQFVLGVDLAYYRYMVNDTRTYDISANTMITPLLPTGGIGLEWLNGVLQFILMFFPVPLISGNPLYISFILILASIAIRLILAIRVTLRSNRSERRSRRTECLALVVAFITVQSIFEPDYGSYIRHLLPVLPLVLYVLCTGTDGGRKAAKAAMCR